MEHTDVFYAWSFPGAPVRVRLRLGALEERGKEIAAPGTGILLGRAAGDRTTEVIRLLPAQNGDISALATVLGDRVAGYYRISSGEPLALNEADLALAGRCFSKPHQVFLRAELQKCGPPTATFFFRRGERLEGDFPVLEFPFDPAVLCSAEWMPPAAAAAEEQPAADPPVPDPPAAEPASEVPGRGAGRWRRGAAVAAAVVLGAVLGVLAAWWFGIPPGWLNTYMQPLLAVCSMIGMAGLIRRKPALMRAALAGFALLSWPPLEWLLSRPLEAWYPVEAFRTSADVQAVVVLSAGVKVPVPERPFSLPDGETFSRCEYAAWIQRSRPELPVLASGGGGQKPPMAETMRELLRRAGVPEAMIRTEERSRNTYESAVYSAALLREEGIRRIALVVDARSMLRAAACFRKQGLEVTPAPSTFRVWDGAYELMPAWSAIARNEWTLHEAAGIVWYRLQGWI
jgi:uncharacterized SAM-binding protein YcdF (DUF218 family)